jgi:hypothetical protein
VQISGQAAAIRKVDGHKWILQPGNGPYYAVVVGKRWPGIPIVLSTWVFCDPVVLMIIQHPETTLSIS